MPPHLQRTNETLPIRAILGASILAQQPETHHLADFDCPVVAALDKSRAALPSRLPQTGSTISGDAYEREPLIESARLAARIIERILTELNGSRARAVDVVYDELDPLLLANCLDDTRVILRAMAQNKLPLAILLSALTVSYPWRAELGDARKELSQKTEQLAREAGGDAKVREIARFL